ncbi:MAG: alpha/beta hydrolase [Actinomycetota bacterium]
MTTHRGTGPPTLFVHGFLAAQAYWMPNLGALADVCQPVVMDLWGHADSPSPGDPSAYTMDGFAAAIEQIRSAAGYEEWVVVSHSLGSAVALHYALRFPERVMALVITNSQSAFATGDAANTMVAGGRTLADRIDQQGMAAFDGHPLNPNRGSRLAPELKESLVAAFARHEPAGLASLLRHTLPEAGTVDRLGELKPPTLLTWGVQEKAFDVGAASARAGIADLRVAELAAGHAVNLHDPAGFNAAVGAFISETTT